MSHRCYRFLTLPHGAIDWFVVCECGIVILTYKTFRTTKVAKKALARLCICLSSQKASIASYKNLLHAPMFTLTVKMSLQMFYSNIMAHMPSAYGLGKNTLFDKVQFSSVQCYRLSSINLLEKRRVHVFWLTHKLHLANQIFVKLRNSSISHYDLLYMTMFKGLG